MDCSQGTALGVSNLIQELDGFSFAGGEYE